jgi:pyrimidine operon attenuation protein/uracil phosphoribosyltransferase
MNKTLVLNAQQMEQKLRRMAWEIYEQNYQEERIILAGIVKRGYIIAERMAAILSEISSMEVVLVKVTVDKENPISHPPIVEEVNYENQVVVLIDDVQKSGKTLMYGAQHFLQAPVKKLMTAVLIDRHYKRFPIQADVIGLALSTTLQEHVSVELGEEEAVYLA